MAKITSWPWFADEAEKAARVMQAMLGRVRLDIAALEQAYAGDDGAGALRPGRPG